MQWNVIISVACTVVGCLIGFYGFRRNEKNDIKQDTREDTKSKVELNAKLDVLLSNNTEIKGSVKELDKKFEEFKDDANVRLTRVEESVKQAHKRIDNIEKK